jgi:hypothetical protein
MNVNIGIIRRQQSVRKLGEPNEEVKLLNSITDLFSDGSFEICRVLGFREREACRLSKKGD